MKFVSIVNDFTLPVSVDDPLYAKYWHLIDRLVQQVVLQQRQGVDPDASVAPINVDNIVQQYVGSLSLFLSLSLSLGHISPQIHTHIIIIILKDWRRKMNCDH
jgi:hypothetical protein